MTTAQPAQKKSRQRTRYWIRLLSVGLVGGTLMALLAIEAALILLITNPAPGAVGSPPPGF